MQLLNASLLDSLHTFTTDTPTRIVDGSRTCSFYENEAKDGASSDGLDLTRRELLA